jgi:23S rRNA (pseudouridine1915-N3)-methyltransferase
MRITIACVGKARAGPEKALFDAYRRRLPWAVELREVEEKRPLPAARRMAREGELLLAAIPYGATLIALDERGQALASAEFAVKLGRWRDSGAGELAFAIGGADGLDNMVKTRATLPHLLARVLLIEQLYRAHSILAGHPYHRA